MHLFDNNFHDAIVCLVSQPVSIVAYVILVFVASFPFDQEL